MELNDEARIETGGMSLGNPCICNARSQCFHLVALARRELNLHLDLSVCYPSGCISAAAGWDDDLTLDHTIMTHRVLAWQVGHLD